MPIRVKSRLDEAVQEPPSPGGGGGMDGFSDCDLPHIEHDDTFPHVVEKLSIFFTDVIQLPSTFEQLRTTSAGGCLRTLVDHLSLTCTNPAIVNALLALKWHYGAASEDKGIFEARANACEIVAWRFLTRLSEREAVEFCLYEIPPAKKDGQAAGHRDEEAQADANESTALLAQPWSATAEQARQAISRTGSSRRAQLISSISRLTMGTSDGREEGEDPTTSFTHLNALEIAAVADAKRLLSQSVVQKIITGVWHGDVIFWDRLSVDATKKPCFYNPNTADPFSRLRVPKYLKIYEVLFFATFLCLYYAVMMERNPLKISTVEVLLYVWLAAFAYDELSDWIDAGSIFYAADVWNVFDITMIAIGLAFAILRVIGLSRDDAHMIDLAFDVLALEALFMVPRVCSILSLSPYWGTLIPCLKEMSKDFLKFMVLVIILYLGFLTTFFLVGRDQFTLSRMTMILTKIFFGSSPTGFDIMDQIDPVFGPPLMLVFVTLSSILLMGSLTGMLSNSFSRVISHAREEYLYVYSVYVLEASTSNRLTHFYPPFNLLALAIFRPLRLVLPSDDRFRRARILLLKATHLPIVAAIQLWELIRGKIFADEFAGFRGPRRDMRPPSSSSSRPPAPARKQRLSPSSYATPRPVSASSISHQLDAAKGDLDGETVPMSRDVEKRLDELTSKIDRLTQLVLNMQAQY